MHNIAPNLSREFHMPSSERRTIIGAHVIGALIMQKLVLHLDELSPGRLYPFDVQLDKSAALFMSIIGNNEYASARKSMKEIMPDSNAHYSREQMGLASKTLQSGIGNQYVLPNQDFIAALHFLEENEIGKKIDVELELSDLLKSTQDNYTAFYVDRLKRTIAIQGSKTNIREPINQAILDSEYWLSTEDPI